MRNTDRRPGFEHVCVIEGSASATSRCLSSSASSARCVVGVENDDHQCEVVRVNLSGHDRHNYLVDRKTAELVAQSAGSPAPSADVIARKYWAKGALHRLCRHRPPDLRDRPRRRHADVGAKILVHAR